MNNGNVNRSAVGVAEGTFDANFNANVSPAVLGMFSRQGLGAKKKPLGFRLGANGRA